MKACVIRSAPESTNETRLPCCWQPLNLSIVFLIAATANAVCQEEPEEKKAATMRRVHRELRAIREVMGQIEMKSTVEIDVQPLELKPIRCFVTTTPRAVFSTQS